MVSTGVSMSPLDATRHLHLSQEAADAAGAARHSMCDVLFFFFLLLFAFDLGFSVADCPLIRRLIPRAPTTRVKIKIIKFGITTTWNWITERSFVRPTWTSCMDGVEVMVEVMVGGVDGLTDAVASASGCSRGPRRHGRQEWARHTGRARIGRCSVARRMRRVGPPRSARTPSRCPAR